MKVKKGQEGSITAPLLKDLVVLDKAHAQQTKDTLNSVGSTPLPQPDLYQDSGSGYNANFVFPQD